MYGSSVMNAVPRGSRGMTVASNAVFAAWSVTMSWNKLSLGRRKADFLVTCMFIASTSGPGPSDLMSGHEPTSRLSSTSHTLGCSKFENMWHSLFSTATSPGTLEELPSNVQSWNQAAAPQRRPLERRVYKPITGPAEVTSLLADATSLFTNAVSAIVALAPAFSLITASLSLAKFEKYDSAKTSKVRASCMVARRYHPAHVVQATPEGPAAVR